MYSNMQVDKHGIPRYLSRDSASWKPYVPTPKVPEAPVPLVMRINDESLMRPDEMQAINWLKWRLLRDYLRPWCASNSLEVGRYDASYRVIDQLFRECGFIPYSEPSRVYLSDTNYKTTLYYDQYACGYVTNILQFFGVNETIEELEVKLAYLWLMHRFQSRGNSMKFEFQVCKEFGFIVRYAECNPLLVKSILEANGAKLVSFDQYYSVPPLGSNMQPELESAVMQFVPYSRNSGRIG